MLEDCLKCGLCKESCYLSQMKIESFVEELFKDAGQEKIWICSNCWACQDSCPQALPLMDYKWEQQRHCKPPEAMRHGFEYIKREGFCLPIQAGNVNAMRADEELEQIIFPSPDILQALFPGID